MTCCMLKARLIGVVTVKDGMAVQSFGFNRYLPLGDPICLVENLDRWGADEIYIQVIDRSEKDLGPDYALIKKISDLPIATPLIYGGGVRPVDEGIQVIKLGADRLALNSMLIDSLGDVKLLSERLGVQAIVGVLPVRVQKNNLEYYDYRQRRLHLGWLKTTAEALEMCLSEVMLVDYLNEGYPGKFDCAILQKADLLKIPLLPFGGLSEPWQIQGVLSIPCVAGFGIGNFLNYKENAVEFYKETVESPRVRSHFS